MSDTGNYCGADGRIGQLMAAEIEAVSLRIQAEMYVRRPGYRGEPMREAEQDERAERHGISVSMSDKVIIEALRRYKAELDRARDWWLTEMEAYRVAVCRELDEAMETGNLSKFRAAQAEQAAAEHKRFKLKSVSNGKAVERKPD